jgi:hypothetical protein
MERKRRLLRRRERRRPEREKYSIRRRIRDVVRVVRVV